MKQEPKIWLQDVNHAVGTWGPLLIQIWRGNKTFHNWRAESSPVFAYVDRTTQAGYCVLIIVEEHAEMPSPEARRDVNELARERQGKVIASAVVALGPLVRTTMVRSLATAVNLFSRNTMRAFGEVDAALAWLVRVAHERQLPLDKAQVQAFVQALRGATAATGPQGLSGTNARP